MEWTARGSCRGRYDVDDAWTIFRKYKDMRDMGQTQEYGMNSVLKPGQHGHEGLKGLFKCSMIHWMSLTCKAATHVPANCNLHLISCYLYPTYISRNIGDGDFLSVLHLFCIYHNKHNSFDLEPYNTETGLLAQFIHANQDAHLT